MPERRGPARLLEGLNDAQREAVALTTGPLAIIAGAGSGKTRVISHRAAYAIETGVVPADRILLVTFTEKAAAEMVERMAALGHRGVAARTFHAHALSQLRHYWPSRHGGETTPQVLRSKLEVIIPLARRLPGHYRFTPAKDLADAIEWAKIRRIEPGRWHLEGGDRAPIPTDLFARVYADYERAKARTGVIDFEDMLIETVRLLESDAEAAATIRARKTWFSVDEYQDTNPLAERLLELWLGESRDLAVVGDPDQTIYSFTGATPEYLLEFERRHQGARTVALVQNYRSTPQILALANRLIAPGPRGALQATLPPGPAPTIRRFVDDEAERAAIVAAIHSLVGQGVQPGEIAVLVRINAQLPDIEQALTRAGIAFRVRGQRFFDRREVKEARRLLTRLASDDAHETGDAGRVGSALLGRIRTLFEQRLGLGGDADAGGDEARERQASLELILAIVADALAPERPAADRPAADRPAAGSALSIADVLAELDRRDAEEAAGSTAGVNLLTYHRAKGLEWDAVFLPALEEGLLPIRQAKEDGAIDEERRLLYVGITRARRHLALSWAARRTGQAGKEANRKPSRFLDGLEPVRSRDGTRGSGARSHALPGAHTSSQHEAPGAAVRRIAALEPLDDAASARDAAERRVLEALQVWRRERARADAVPAYVVAHDAMLFAIADAHPESITALARVKGIGPAKLDRYGTEILEIVTRSRSGA